MNLCDDRQELGHADGGCREDVQAELGLRDLETTFSFELDVADTQVCTAEVDGKVRALLVTGRPSKDVRRKHRLQEASANPRQLCLTCSQAGSGRTTSCPGFSRPRSRTSMNESTILHNPDAGR